jgi:hypothetical protein
MARKHTLKQWIQEQYRVIGINSNGTFVGKAQFKLQLIERYASSERAKGCKKDSLKQVNRAIEQLVDE